MPKGKQQTQDEMLRDIRKLLIISVLRSGVKPAVIAKLIGYKNERSLSNEFPVKKIREKSAE